MLPSSDPLITRERGGSNVGYQSIEGGPSSDSPAISTQSFLSQVRAAKQNSQGCCDFFLTFVGLLIGSIVWTIVMIITLTLPLVMIILGSAYFHDCPGQRMIPIFNIVAGCVIMINNIMNLVVRYQQFSESEMPRRPTVVGWITTVLNIFLLAWFIAGCYWVYGIYPPNENGGCDNPLYSFSFWLMNACFIFFGSMVIVSTILMCCVLICW